MPPDLAGCLPRVPTWVITPVQAGAGSEMPPYIKGCPKAMKPRENIGVVTMDTKAKTYGLFIKPSALRVEGQLRNYRWAIARLASSIWWHLNLADDPDADEYGAVTVIKAVTNNEPENVPFHIEMERKAMLEELPTFDSVLDLCIDLFTQMFRVHKPELCKVDYGDGNIVYSEQSSWKLIVNALKAETFCEMFLETDESHAEDAAKMKDWPYHYTFVDEVVEL